MAYSLPNTMAPDVSMERGISHGTNFYNMLVQHAMQKAQERRAQEKFPLELAHMRGAESRANSASARNAELQPLQKMLLQAKAQSAASNAAWNNMLMGGGNQGTQTPSEPISQPSPESQNYDALKGHLQGQGMMANPSNMQQSTVQPEATNQLEHERIIEPGNPTLHAMDRFAGIKGIPQAQTHYDTNGNLITRYPSGKVTMQKIGPSARDIALQEGFDKQDAKIVGELQESSLGAQDLNNSYESLGEAFSNPLWNTIHTGLLEKGGEKGRRLNLDVVRNYGTKEQKDLLAQVETTSNELVSKMAKVFKGPFRIAEQSLIERVKPQAYDTPEAAQAKLLKLREALEKQQYINTRIPDLIRKEHLPANDAFKVAFDEVGGKEFKDSLAEKYGSSGKQEAMNLKKEAERLNLNLEDIEFTAKKKGITPEQVIQRYERENKHGS